MTITKYAVSITILAIIIVSAYFFITRPEETSNLPTSADSLDVCIGEAVENADGINDESLQKIQKCYDDWFGKGKVEIITLPILPRGDLADPGPIEDECERRRNEYTQKNTKFTECKIFESKAGYDLDKCGGFISFNGCSICRLECR